MKNTLILLGAFVVFSLPVLSYAAFNTLTLTNSVVPVAGFNLSLTGHIEKIVTRTNDFDVVLSPGSSLTVVSADKKGFSLSTVGTSPNTTTCNSGDTTLTFTSPASLATTTISITASCSSTVPVTPVTPTPAPTITQSNGSIAAIPPGGSGLPNPFPGAPVMTTASSGGLSTDQVHSIISLLSVFGADDSVIKSVTLALAGSGAAGAAPLKTTFKSLAIGSRGSSVAGLQNLLIRLSFLKVTSADVLGLYGPKTERAVKDFQCAHKIVCSGTPATTGWGFVGPKTQTVLDKAGQ